MSEYSIRRIAIIGTGTIGASWAAYDLAREKRPAVFTGR
jgi:3-hydroxyacyl-CoA dehydrogenase